ncbi:MAG: carbohydrate binding domain-containing protein [Planctomycetota bacterium]
MPFVIPAKPNLDSPITVTSYEPILIESDRLIANGGHFHYAGKRVRLWGVNLSFGANLPTHEDAPFIAARMAAAGVNTVRCHHLDTSRWPRGLWNSRDGKTVEPEALDRLDFFIKQLALHGIFVNLNLHVGRAHSEYIGLPKTNRQYDKISNIFTPSLVDAQKKFAREMLDRVNPYRKVRYADDPAIAIVEITNENSFFMWSSEETLRTLPKYYADILQKKFNSWLRQQYGSDQKLREVWSEGAQPLGDNLLKEIELKSGRVPNVWQLEQHSDCKAVLRRQKYLSKDALRIGIDKANETEWHLQFKQAGFAVEEGQYYTVTFEAASEKPRKLSCGVSQAHEPWQNLGLSRRVDLTQEWKTFRFGFVAKEDDGNARLSFSFGGNNDPFYLANIKLQPGGRVGLRRSESVTNDSVQLYADSESPKRMTDRMIFLAETEKAYFDDMRNFIKSDLGCKALVTGTIVFGPLGLYAQSDMDFIDAHAYWQHPRFPGRPWDSGNWLINQKPMTDFPAEATLFRIAAERLVDKPFTVSEYNHPAPLDSQAECVPMIASFGAAHDWDGIWFYTYSHSTDEWDREHMNSYFDIDTNPAKWGFMRAGTAIFRDNCLGKVGHFTFFSLAEPSDGILNSLVRLHHKYDRDMAELLADRAEISWQYMLETGVSLTFEKSRLDRLKRRSGGSGWLKWSIEDGRGLYVANKVKAAVFAGHTSRFRQVTDDIHISNPSYAVMTITSLDGMSVWSSKKILITACGRCENTGMKFSDDRQTVGRNWGEAPVRIETVTGTVNLPEGQWKCEALGPDGMPKHEVPVNNGAIKLSPEYGTMWYLLTQ